MLMTSGDRLGAYEVIGHLGSGGMGDVYRARDTRLQRDVAVKVLSSALSSDPDRLSRFEQEARATAALNHPNIVAVFDIGSHHGQPFIVSELLEGEPLGHKLRSGPLPMRTALDYGKQIATGLAASHDKGIVHRDLKPDNVFITRDGRAKILDFGIAKLLAVPSEPETSLALTAPGTAVGLVLGTPGYMAPEQIRGDAVDHRTDLFALGAMLFEMLSGARPFAGSTHADTMSAVLTREPPDLVTPEGPVPPSTDRIIRRCLEKQPEHRFQSARDLAFALGTMTSETLAPGSLGESRPAAQTARRPRRRELAAWALATLSAATLVWLYFQRTDGSLAPAATIGRFTIESPIDTTALTGIGLAIAPDGKTIAVSGTSGPNERRIYVRRLDGSTFGPLQGTEGATQFFWSPDSRTLAFFKAGDLKRVDIGSTQSTVVARLVGDAPIRFGAWGTGGEMLVSAPHAPLHRVLVQGGDLRPVGALDAASGETEQTAPVFLPDGRRYFYMSLRSGGPVTVLTSLDSTAGMTLAGFNGRVIWAGTDQIVFRRGRGLYAQQIRYDPLAVHGEPVLLAGDTVQPANPWLAGASVSESSALVYRADSPPQQFRWIRRDGQGAAPVGPRGEYPTFDLSLHGTKAAVSRGEAGAYNVWILDTTNGSDSRLTIGPFSDVDPRLSPDGKSVIFGSTRDPARSPFRISVIDDSQPSRVFAFSGRGRFALDDWSADGRWLLYHDSATPVLLAAQLAQPERAPIVVARGLTGILDQPQMSPDGRWVSYNSNESGRFEVFVVPFPATGEKWRVSVDGGVQPTWNRAGTELYFLALDGTMMSARLQTGTTFSAGKPVALFKTGLSTVNGQIEQYAPAPDGTRFLLVDYIDQQRELSLTVMTNWRALTGKPGENRK